MLTQKILVVDDDDDLRSMLAITLSNRGHDITLAANGVEALQAMSGAEFDVVLTDLLMPGKDGLELIGELCRRGTHPRIVAMSGGSRGPTAGYLDLARRFGADAVLAKPFSTSELVSAMGLAVPDYARCPEP